MSEFKLGDLIRPKRNPTYLPDEIKVVVGFDSDDVYVDTMPADGSATYSSFERIDEMKPAYPIPIRVGDLVTIRQDVKFDEILKCTHDKEDLFHAMQMMTRDSNFYVTSVIKDGKMIRVEGGVESYPTALFDLVERAEAKIMTHDEIECMLGFRFEMEDEN